MSTEETLRKLFSSLGMTPYEVSAYTSLVLKGKLSASELSRAAKIPQSKIYSVIQLLEMRRMIETEQGFPKKYSAVEPSGAAKKIIEEKEKQIEKLNNEVEASLVNILPNIKAPEEISEERVWTVVGREEFLHKVIELVSKAKKSAYLLTLNFSINEHLAKAIKSAARRGCDCRAIGFVEKNNTKQAKKYLEAGAKVRHVKHSWIRFAVIDEKWICFRLAQPEKNIYTLIWSASPALAKIFYNQYLNIWKEAEDAAPLIKKLSH